MAEKTEIDCGCVVCGKKDRIMKRCGRCQAIFYCSVECQKCDWIKHRASCLVINLKQNPNSDGTAFGETVKPILTKCKTVHDRNSRCQEFFEPVAKSEGQNSINVNCDRYLADNIQTTLLENEQCSRQNYLENKVSREKDDIPIVYSMEPYSSSILPKTKRKSMRNKEILKTTNHGDESVCYDVLEVDKNPFGQSSFQDPTESLPSDGKGFSENSQSGVVKAAEELTELKGNRKEFNAKFSKQEILRNEKAKGDPSITEDCTTRIKVFAKYAKQKHEIEMCLPCTGMQALKAFSCVLRVPYERLKLIHKGKLQTESTIVERLNPNSVFLAFGETAENENGLEPEDIELIMKQLSVERNVAIKALRKTNCLLDAIFEIGNG